jgi:hypothetical protein
LDARAPVTKIPAPGVLGGKIKDMCKLLDRGAVIPYYLPENVYQELKNGQYTS